MPDAKSLQMGTSHYLGQGFAKAFKVEYLDKEGKNNLGIKHLGVFQQD